MTDSSKPNKFLALFPESLPVDPAEVSLYYAEIAQKTRPYDIPVSYSHQFDKNKRMKRLAARARYDRKLKPSK